MPVAWMIPVLAITACAASGPGASSGSDGRAVPDFPEGWGIPASSVVPVLATDGMVSTTDRIASEIGAEILRRGGNAVDAAIATHFALAVVNPEAGNIGGGGFMIVRMVDGTTASLDFREKAPMAATADMYLDEEGNLTDKLSLIHI